MAALRMHAVTSLLADDRDPDRSGAIDLDGLLAAPLFDALTGFDPQARGCPEGPGHDHGDRPARPAGRVGACFDHGD
jgi:hypothetical protein